MKRKNKFIFYIIKYMFCRWTFVTDTAEIICDNNPYVRLLIYIKALPRLYINDKDFNGYEC